MIDESTVDIVNVYKYLGVNIEDNLKWNVHIDGQVKKASKRLYHVRCLRNLYVDNSLICLMYNSLISSILTYAVCCWFGSASEGCKRKIVSIRKRVCKMVGPDFVPMLDDPADIFNKRCVKLATKIISDNNHPLNIFYQLLPSGSRYRSTKCRTERYRKTFIPTSIRMLNE
jgi:hypothetical protein